MKIIVGVVNDKTNIIENKFLSRVEIKELLMQGVTVYYQINDFWIL